jgi:hypothetical protein
MLLLDSAAVDELLLHKKILDFGYASTVKQKFKFIFNFIATQFSDIVACCWFGRSEITNIAAESP